MCVSCLLRPRLGGGTDKGWGEGATARGGLGRLVPTAWAKQLGCPGWVARGRAPRLAHPKQTLRATAPPRSLCLRSGAATSWGPPPRVHTSPHTLGNGPREPRCPPGVAGLGRKPESRPLLAWDSLPTSPTPRPALPGLGVISVPTKETEARNWRWQLAPFPRAAPPGNRQLLPAPLPQPI